MTVKTDNEQLLNYFHQETKITQGNQATNINKNDIYTPSTETYDRYTNKNVSLPTKNYVDNIISEALNNIKNGENIAENRRVLNIFSNIVGENPVSKELKSYIA